MLNQLLNDDQSEVAKTQLLDLLSHIDKAVQDGTLVAIEQINAAVQAAISKSCADIYAPIFKAERATEGTTPNPDQYNSIFTQLLSDITTVFSELKYTGDIVLANFNRLVTEEASILARTKKIYNQLQDLDLFSSSTTSRALFESDDFVDFDKIDFDERFIEDERCFIDVEQGIITLPQAQASSGVIVSDVKINEISNGVVGNNQQIDVPRHGNINDILDSNPDTWFEYESVVLVPTEETLVLSLTLQLADEYIVNNIRVNPNNFGSSNWIKITSLETSVDDRTYTSIKDVLPIEGFIELDTEDEFILSPAVSKFAGQGIYTFTPRKAKYVRIVIEQPQGYYIESLDGQRFRYAIGLRDLEVYGIEYNAIGSLVSLPFALTEDIRKVALLAVENPVRPSDVATIEHYISVDDGATWYQLQPVSGEDPNAPKILTFNDESEGAIKTDARALTIRHKVVLKRESDGFKADKSAISEKTTSIAELRQLPAGEPFNVSIKQRPIASSVRIVNPIFGSKGWSSPKLYVGTSDGTPGQTFEAGVSIRAGEEKVYVDSQLWTSVEQFDSEYQYVINYEHGENRLPLIKFGFNNSIPLTGSIISIELPAENLVVEGQEPHFITLENLSDGDKNAMELVRHGVPTIVYGERMAQVATRHYLRNKNLDDSVSLSFNTYAATIFTDEKTFIDGVTELISFGDYSVDYVNGIIYAKELTDDDEIATVGYTYTPLEVVSSDEWKFIDKMYQTLELKHTSFRSIQVEDDLNVQSGQQRVALSNETVVRGSVKFSDTDLFLELPFIDGITEFLDIIEVQDEDVDIGGNSFNLDNFPVISVYPVVFSDTAVFAREIPVPVQAGDYFIDYATGQVDTFSTLDNGTVSYHYQDTNKAGDLDGSYSIDYREGVIYFYEDLPTTVTATYEYTRYAMRYRIAKELEGHMFTVNPDDQLITITDPAVMDDYLPTTRNAGLIKVFYDYIEQVRESIEELEPYFTPVVKGYALKILTPGLL